MVDGPPSSDAQKPTSTHRPTRRVVRIATSLAFVLIFLLISSVWVIVIQPYDPPQLPSSSTSLDRGLPSAVPTMPVHPEAITVLTYHAVPNAHTPSTATSVTREQFGQHMSALKSAGFHTIRLADAERAVLHQSVSLPPKPLLLTFDDGALTDWTTVDPILEANRFNAVAFLVTARVVNAGKPSFYLSKREVQLMDQSGRWEFGSHTDNLHDYLPVGDGKTAPALTNRILVNGQRETLPDWNQRVRIDLQRSQQFFREVLGHSTTTFAYPFGDSDSSDNTPQLSTELPMLLEAVGFDVAFIAGNPPSGHVDALGPWSPQWKLPRISINSTTTVTDLFRAIRYSIPVLIPNDLSVLPWAGTNVVCVRNVPRAARSLSLSSASYGTCALGDVNTSRWTDYVLRARVIGLNRNATAIFGVRDGAGTEHEGRLEVLLGESNIIVREDLGHTSKVLATALIPQDQAAQRVRDVEIRVRGNQATVNIQGIPPITVYFDPLLNAGAVQFSIAPNGQRSLVFESPTLIDESVTPPGPG